MNLGLKEWIIKEMQCDKWYIVNNEDIDEYQKLCDYFRNSNIELTFNNDYTKIKKTVWKDGKPI